MWPNQAHVEHPWRLGRRALQQVNGARHYEIIVLQGIRQRARTLLLPVQPVNVHDDWVCGMSCLTPDGRPRMEVLGVCCVTGSVAHSCCAALEKRREVIAPLTPPLRIISAPSRNELLVSSVRGGIEPELSLQALGVPADGKDAGSHRVVPAHTQRLVQGWQASGHLHCLALRRPSGPVKVSPS